MATFTRDVDGYVNQPTFTQLTPNLHYNVEKNGDFIFMCTLLSFLAFSCFASNYFVKLDKMISPPMSPVKSRYEWTHYIMAGVTLMGCWVRMYNTIHSSTLPDATIGKNLRMNHPK